MVTKYKTGVVCILQREKQDVNHNESGRGHPGEMGPQKSGYSD